MAMRRIGFVAWLFLLLPTTVLPQAAWAHGGGLDRNGCHADRKAGDRHCHRGSTFPAPGPARKGDVFRSASPLDQRPAVRAYRKCTEARAAGAAPERRGEPRYGAHLDRDNDGIGCEPYRGR